VSLRELVQAAADRDGGTPPQFGCVGVPHDGR
jgi:hypothetical protein